MLRVDMIVVHKEDVLDMRWTRDVGYLIFT